MNNLSDSDFARAVGLSLAGTEPELPLSSRCPNCSASDHAVWLKNQECRDLLAEIGRLQGVIVVANAGKAAQAAETERWKRNCGFVSLAFVLFIASRLYAAGVR